MEKQLVPQLRFPEFKEVWTKENLQKLCKKTISYGIVQTGANIEEGVPCVRVVDLTGVNLDVENMIKTSEEISNSYKKTILEENEVMLALRGDIGFVKLVEKSLVGANITRGVARLSADENLINPFFLNWVIQSNKALKQINKQVNGSALKEIPLGGLRKVSVFLSGSLIEQQKIASFLSSVDEKINQLQRKKELLQDYKKGMMQQLFSQQLRFKDANGSDFPEWEEKKLGKVGRIIGGGTPPTTNDDFWNGNIQWFTPTEIKSNYVSKSSRTITDLGLKKSSAKILPKGTILLTTRATIGDVAIAEEECTTNQGFQSIIVNKNNNNVFLANWIKMNKNLLIRRANGSTFIEISKSEIQKIKIHLPSKEEQTKIATFLSALDAKIDTVSTAITQTQDFKKGLLQQMFV